MIKTLVDPNNLPELPNIFHPITGRPLRAVGFKRNGSPIWPILGGAEEDGSEGSDDGDTDDEKDDDDTEDSTDEKSKGATVPKSELDKLQAAFDKMKNQLSASDRNKSAAEKKLEEIERKKRGDLENAQKDLEEKTKINEKLADTVKKMAIANAFVEASMAAKISWHDLKVAMQAAELKDIEVNDDGEVVGDVKKIVKDLAKDKKYLVNSSTDTDEDDDEEPKGKTGSPVGSGARGKGKAKAKELTPEELRKMFPALNK